MKLYFWAILLILALAGCATTTPLDRAARSLATTTTTVDAAMQGYAAAVVLNLVSADDQTKVRKLYEDYQAAVLVAETAIITAIKTGDDSRLAALTNALTAARDPLLAFLARFDPVTRHPPPVTLR